MAKKIVKILSIDGGGVRGMIPAMVLAELEKRMGQPVAKIFDVIAGTSIGSILTLGLTVHDKKGNPLYSAEDMVKMFEKESKHIFANSLWHKLITVEGIRDSKYSNEGLKKS